MLSITVKILIVVKIYIHVIVIISPILNLIFQIFHFLPRSTSFTYLDMGILALPLDGDVVEWLTRRINNLRIASHMGSNPVRDKPLFP